MSAGVIANKAERLYAQMLDGMGVKWERPECRRFPLNGTSYTPDFYLPASDIFVEVIGTAARWPQVRPKVAAVRRAYPKTNLIVVDKNGKEWPGSTRDELGRLEPEPVYVNYILRGIPEPFWRQVRVAAITRDETIQAAILRLLAGYIK